MKSCPHTVGQSNDRASGVAHAERRACSEPQFSNLLCRVTSISRLYYTSSPERVVGKSRRLLVSFGRCRIHHDFPLVQRQSHEYSTLLSSFGRNGKEKRRSKQPLKIPSFSLDFWPHCISPSPRTSTLRPRQLIPIPLSSRLLRLCLLLLSSHNRMGCLRL